MIFEGTVWRHIPQGAHPLHIGYILRASGRWNRAGLYGALYTSLSMDGALAELKKNCLISGIALGDLAPRDLVSIKVKCKPVLNLTKAATRRKVDITLTHLRNDSADSIDRCRIIADWSRQQGFRCILTPSAALKEAQNLIIFFEGPAEHLELDEGSKRFPINYSKKALLDILD